MEFLKMQLKDTFQSLKQEGLVDDTFTFLYSMKETIEDKFFIELVPNFCSEVQDVLKILAQIVNNDVLDYNLMKEYTCKVKGSSLSVGACRMANALINFQHAIDDEASKEECMKALNQAQHEYSVLEGRLHMFLQIERRIVLLATNRTNP